MADDDEDIAALVIDNGSGMCKGTILLCIPCGMTRIREVAEINCQRILHPRSI